MSPPPSTSLDVGSMWIRPHPRIQLANTSARGTTILVDNAFMVRSALGLLIASTSIAYAQAPAQPQPPPPPPEPQPAPQAEPGLTGSVQPYPGTNPPPAQQAVAPYRGTKPPGIQAPLGA